jgi:hypothetical protein
MRRALVERAVSDDEDYPLTFPMLIYLPPNVGSTNKLWISLIGLRSFGAIGDPTGWICGPGGADPLSDQGDRLKCDCERRFRNPLAELYGTLIRLHKRRRACYVQHVRFDQGLTLIDDAVAVLLMQLAQTIRDGRWRGELMLVGFSDGRGLQQQIAICRPPARRSRAPRFDTGAVGVFSKRGVIPLRSGNCQWLYDDCTI